MGRRWRLAMVAVIMFIPAVPSVAAPTATPARIAALASQADAGNPHALQELRSFARAGNAAAQFDLGQAYYDGQGVPQNYAKAAEWYRKAAMQRYAVAQGKLGAMYYDGHGVPQNYTSALKWLILAKAGGSKTDANLMHDVDNLMRAVEQAVTPAQVAQAQKLASQWWAAHHGSH